ncbi:MAG TPA: helix-turn-helix transcriptional regulator [Cyclobacteriaceae bacterium]|nr:helix-turn-helix transcriptional regulator [Cyclobacteriaceae bacterium]
MMTPKKTSLEKTLDKLAKRNPPSHWTKRWEYRKENRHWLRMSVKIALTILDTLDDRNMSKTQFAKRIKMSNPKISKILRGHDNLSLKTISRLEGGLGIKLCRVLDGDKK